MQIRSKRHGGARIHVSLLHTMYMLAVVLALTVLTALAAAASEADRMPDLEEGRPGSLTLRMQYTDPNLDEEDKIRPLAEVVVHLIRVADVQTEGGSVTYTLLPAFERAGIDFAGMTASESIEAAAKLMERVVDSDSERGITDDDGRVTYARLEAGMYLAYQQTDANAAYRVDAIAPQLLMVPYPERSEEGNSWQYEVLAYPKVELDSPKNNGKIRVVKELYNTKTKLPFAPPEGVELVFYVALFEDEAFTRQAEGTGVMELRFKDSTEAEAVFENLKTDQTYYLAEVDQTGKVIGPVDYSSLHFTADYPEGQIVTVTRDKPETAIRFRNTTEGGGGNYMAELKITKNTVKDGKPFEVSETYYAAIFTDPEYKNRVGEVIPLKITKGSTVSRTLKVNLGTEADASVVYYVVETDKDGKPLENGSGISFSVSVSPADGKVTLTLTDSKAEVIIVNNYSPEKNPTPTPTPGNPPSTYTPPKTGDTSNILLWSGLLAASIVLLVVCFGLGRRRK